MIQRLLLLLLTAGLGLGSQAQIVYNDGQTLITGTWLGNGTLTETSADQPYEGNAHYRFDYSFTGYWAGLGLNMDGWGSGSTRDFSGYTHLRMAYRGLSQGQVLTLRLRSPGDVYGPEIPVGGASNVYSVVDIPFADLGLGMNLSNISELNLSVSSSTASGSGTLYFDAIELVNVAPPPPPPPSEAWPLANALGKGFNLSNWLEAYWLIPFNAYPEAAKYNEGHVALMAAAGFTHVRLPVTFERLTVSPGSHTLNMSHISFSLVDSVVAWTARHDMKLIIVNHHGYELTDANAAAETPRLASLWSQLADRYAALPADRVLFELYNEPTSAISNQNFRPIAQAMVAAVRQHSPAHALVLGATGWNSSTALSTFVPLPDLNIVYTFHHYDPYLYTHQGMSWTSPPYFANREFPLPGDNASVRNSFLFAANWSAANDSPVYLGEFGAASAASASSRCAWVSLMTHLSDSLGMAYAYWDPLNWNDAFGFFDPAGGLHLSSIVPCFAEAMALNTTPLAVSEGTLAAHCDGAYTHIRWAWQGRALEAGAQDYLELEYTRDGMSWHSAGRKAVLEGQHRYHWAVLEEQGDRLYRVCHRDGTGGGDCSPVVSWHCPPADGWSVYPNPAQGQLHVAFGRTEVGVRAFYLYDQHGRAVRSWPGGLAPHYQLGLSGLPAGLYHLVAQLDDGRTAAERVVVLR